nr:phospholipase A2 inhibitor and Ly6/PLAUR domain-containing protein-like [Anolis sagrei ordinatus]
MTTPIPIEEDCCCSPRKGGKQVVHNCTGGYESVSYPSFPGRSFECEVCRSRSSTCSGHRQRCNRTQTICAVMLVENTHEGKPQLYAIKSCAERKMCNPPFQSLNMGRGRYERSKVICCEGNNCKKAVARFQPGFIMPNGKQCPACFAKSRSECGTARVDCSGDEYYCMEVMQSITLGKSKFLDL